jgi:peptidoglycan/xylan/chitin deacetylase (PgdA/CDA1 family)
MDTPFMMTPNRKFELEKIMDACEKNDGILVVNFHNDKFNNNDFPGYRDAYIEIIEAGKERAASFNTLGNFYEQYRNKFQNT